MLIGVIKNQYVLLVSFAFIGIAWSSISNIPYRIISDTAPENKMTAYFTVFNFSVVIPQITAAFLLGYINKHFFAGETINIILLGACSMFLSGLLMLFIKRRTY
jgi:maltose/moltooligosaccharide transporter